MSAGFLISAPELSQRLGSVDCILFDCRFDLMHPQAGRNSWLAGHIPGAVYAHLDNDLAGPVTAQSGRHPLPTEEDFAQFLGRSGWEPGKLSVAYDGGGGLIASRLWWLMKYFGLDDCVLLDGGMAAWTSASLPIESGEPRVDRRPAPRLSPRPQCVLGTGQVAKELADGNICLLDARAAARFRGEVEPIDSVSGHVPGARNHPCENNLREDKRLRSGEELRKMLAPFAGRDGSKRVVHMCGSGVTACHNVFAMELAGFGNNQLYEGSWSEWIRDPSRPIAEGED